MKPNHTIFHGVNSLEIEKEKRWEKEEGGLLKKEEHWQRESLMIPPNGCSQDAHERESAASLPSSRLIEKSDSEKGIFLRGSSLERQFHYQCASAGAGAFEKRFHYQVPQLRHNTCILPRKTSLAVIFIFFWHHEMHVNQIIQPKAIDSLVD